MQQRKRRLADIRGEMGLPSAVLFQRLVHDEHGGAGVVDDGGHEGAQAGRLGERGGAGRVPHVGGLIRVLGEEGQGGGVLEDAADDLLGEVGVVGDGGVGGCAGEGNGGPEVKVVEDVETSRVWHDLGNDGIITSA